MRFLSALLLFALLPTLLSAQFKPTDKDDLTIKVTDGTDDGRHSELVKKDDDANATKKNGRDIPTSYDQIPEKPLVFQDTIRPLGMSDAIQAAAFIERPKFGLAGFLLIFCVNDSIGGMQGTYESNGETHKGVYRLIRQKFTPEEPIPRGMTPYTLGGTFFIIGVS